MPEAAERRTVQPGTLLVAARESILETLCAYMLIDMFANMVAQDDDQNFDGRRLARSSSLITSGIIECLFMALEGIETIDPSESKEEMLARSQQMSSDLVERAGIMTKEEWERDEDGA